MKVVRVTGTATATIKAQGLAGHKLLVVDVIDAREKVLEASIVAVDTVGAGRGDLCLMVEGSAARIPANGLPIDAALIAVIDTISV